MKTTNIFRLRSRTAFKSSSILLSLGLLLGIIVLSLPSCELERFDDIYPDPAEYDSLTLTTTNGKFDKFKLDSVYLADIVVGISGNGDTIRFVKDVDGLTYYFIAPSTLPVGTHQVRINALRTLLSIKIDTLTGLGNQTADAIISNYLRDEVTPNINYFNPATPTTAAQLGKIRDTTQFLFNTLNANQKRSVAIILLANKNFFKDFNTALRNLRSVPINTVGPSAVCTGADYKTYYPCLFEALGLAYSSLETHGRLLVAFARALNGSFFYINSTGEYRLRLNANPSLVSGLLQFANVLPKAMIVGDLGNRANNRTWILNVDFSQVPATAMFTHNIIDTIPVKLNYRNIRDTDIGSALIGTYVSRFNAFRTWWKDSPLSFFPVAPALTPQTAPLALNDLDVSATLTLGSTNVTKGVTVPSVLEDGFRVRFRIDAETAQNTTITLSVSNQGFSDMRTFNATVKPQN
ncbi:MAG: hypothetical protein SFV55_06480 [Haliscomenobacter sp.]|uniref:hypothetical protein n=1 Tax=Haliscomenobacter sp. TaxID=2717303 RepID=UPI0029ADEFB6|nr:hypothetical protein [Haliscomenobacter sp.]MDX2068053.1 hypothetical protein [Haliscomenobacter sp.]